MIMLNFFLTALGIGKQSNTLLLLSSIIQIVGGVYKEFQHAGTGGELVAPHVWKLVGPRFPTGTAEADFTAKVYTPAVALITGTLSLLKPGK